jgi:hypothetical protein
MTGAEAGTTAMGGTNSGGEGGMAQGGGANGGEGGMGSMPDATASGSFVSTGEETGWDAIAGTLTFSEEAGMVTMTVNITAGCPAGAHISHIHSGSDCENRGSHWLPNGEVFDAYICDESGAATYEHSEPTTTWTVGGDPGTDVTQFVYVLHQGPGPGNDMAGGQAACVEINLDE